MTARISELPSRYNPQEVEERLYRSWEAQGLFHADTKSSRPRYTIVIPPPNVTGILHMGHALNNTIQDILIRMKRMQGANALWLPGTDHAGIATQNVVEKALAKDGKSRQDLGREAFVERVWHWKERYGSTIIHQLKRLGASCDWARTRFTMDKGLSEAVCEVFVRLYKKGLVYRGNYIINWCPHCHTALADEEAPRREVLGKLYHIRYPLDDVSRSAKTQKVKGEARSFIEVATTRPETMLGDTAIAVNPKDKRYKAFIGKRAILPLADRKLLIIADELVDPNFGTGAVKVTPAHDPADFQMGKKHKLEFINVMTDDARMTNVPDAYRGMDRFECRSRLIVDLERQGCLGQVDEHRHNVGHCYRCQTAVEPRLSPQWFVSMKELARPAIKAVERGTIRFSPDRWRKVYLNWMRQIEDWCISRQIWWGHRLPVYYCAACREQAAHSTQQTADRGYKKRQRKGESAEQAGVIVSKVRPKKCPRCGCREIVQDEDVLDTWFSSWLWPFSTLGWPKKTKDLSYFYPTNTLVTAPDIIFFWVARMIMAGYFCTGKPPFSRVAIHGTIRDITGKKMSKSLGNSIDPLDIIRQYGTDALRYTLVTATTIGQDIFLDEERFAAGRNFANKIWNAARYVLTTVASTSLQPTCHKPQIAKLSVPDRWILSRLQRTIQRVSASLDKFLISDAAGALYEFIWRDFCDWYVEISKIELGKQTLDSRQQTPPKADPLLDRACGASRQTVSVLVCVLETSLRLLHPFMPFVTEELWQQLNAVSRSRATRKPKTANRNSVMVAPWPKPTAGLIDTKAEAHMNRLKAVVGAIRNTRAELHVPVSARPAMRIWNAKPSVRGFFEKNCELVRMLTSAGEVVINTTRQRAKRAAAIVVDGMEVHVLLSGIIDAARERCRMQERIQELREELSRLEARLNDNEFVNKAPSKVVERFKTRRTEAKETLEKCAEHLELLRAL